MYVTATGMAVGSSTSSWPSGGSRTYRSRRQL